MSTIITALVLIAFTIGIPMILISRTKQENKKRNRTLLNSFIQEGTDRDLAFSTTEVLRSKIIGLDTIKNKVFVYEFENPANTMVLTMDKINKCIVEKNYGTIDSGAEKIPKSDYPLRSIDLKFAFKEHAAPVAIHFYDNRVNSIMEMAELEAKAKRWEAVLSAIIFKEQKIRA